MNRGKGMAMTQGPLRPPVVQLTPHGQPMCRVVEDTAPGWPMSLNIGIQIQIQIQPPPPPTAPSRPKFQPPQSEGAGRGLVPLGDQEIGEQTFCCPYPPQQKWGRTESRPSTPPPPPSMPSHPHCRPSHGDRGPTPHGQGADAERRVCWDLGPAW